MVKLTEAMREEARRIVAEYYDYEVVENVSLHCIEVEFVLKGMLRAQSPDDAAPSAPKGEGSAPSLSEADCIRCWEAEGGSPFTRRMFLCPECGNKRCPKATDHRNACTGSNEPGQHGSDYA